MVKQRAFKTGITLVFLLLLALSGLATTTAEDMSDLPSRTPIPTVTQTPTATPTSSAPDPVLGAFITLTAVGETDYWTQIQWLAGDGEWYDVNGWTGHTNNQIVTWYVGTELVGNNTMFRWLIFEEMGGDLLGTSEVFYMPTVNGETVEVRVEQ